MSKKQKNIDKVLSLSVDITFEEIVTFLGYFNYRLVNKGKTSGSRVCFVSNDGHKIYFHRPHPSNIVKRVYIAEIILSLKKEGKL